MTDQVVPKITIPVDPANIARLWADPTILGGVRQKVTIYAVVETDMSNKQSVAVLTAPMHAKVEVRIVE